jgi:hypothetical protein
METLPDISGQTHKLTYEKESISQILSTGSLPTEIDYMKKIEVMKEAKRVQIQAAKEKEQIEEANHKQRMLKKKKTSMNIARQMGEKVTRSRQNLNKSNPTAGVEAEAENALEEQEEPPLLDPRICLYTAESKKPITSFLQSAPGSQSSRRNGEYKSVTESIKISYGVTYN